MTRTIEQRLDALEANQKVLLVMCTGILILAVGKFLGI